MRRAVRTVIRLIAAGFIVVGGMNAGLEYMRHRMQGAEVNTWRVVLGSLGILAGIALFAASSPLAKRMTEDFEE